MIEGSFLMNAPGVKAMAKYVLFGKTDCVMSKTIMKKCAKLFPQNYQGSLKGW